MLIYYWLIFIISKIMELTFDKKTFNLNREYSDLMKAIIPSRKQTEFVNRAIKKELEREQEKLERQKILKNLETLRKKRETMPKSTLKSEEVIRELREGSINKKHKIATNQANDE
jgi:hypothetical protein